MKWIKENRECDISRKTAKALWRSCGKDNNEFDMDLFFRIVEKMSVFDGKKIIVTLLDGTEIEVLIK